MSLPITICSSSYNCEDHVKYNLLNMKDRSDNFKWIVAHSSRGDNKDNPIKDPSVEVIKGSSQLEINRAIYDGRQKNIGYGSYEHGLNINRCLKYVDTKYALILDPDCYILQDFDTVLMEMERDRLVSLGITYQESLSKLMLRGTPIATCMFINMELLGMPLDFTPGYMADTEYYTDCGFKVYKKLLDRSNVICPRCESKSCRICLMGPFGKAIRRLSRLDVHLMHKKNGLDELFCVHAHMRRHTKNTRHTRASGCYMYQMIQSSNILGLKHR